MGDTVTKAIADRTAASISRETVEAIAAAANEPAWMLQRRLEAWRLYESMPLPQPTEEAWRRTNISGLRLEEATVPLAPTARALSPAADLLPTDERSGLLAQRDGTTVARALDESLARQGVLFMDLQQALRESDLVREHLFSVVRPDELKFRTLHAAFWRGGAFLYAPRGVEVTLPLHSATWIDTAGALIAPHTLIIADEGSKVTLVESFGSPVMPRQTVVTSAVELIVRDAAQVRYIASQDWGANVWEFGIIRAHLGRDATLNSLVVAWGGSLIKTDVESMLRGQGASSEMLGVYFASRDQHMDFHTLQEHLAPHTLSDLLYKGAVKDQARTVFAGLIRVHPGAQKTNAFQSNRNLLLNVGARADSIPKLEIMANDLRCTHGSATSRLQEEHLFYLMSRGLTRRQAVQMVVDGFFGEVVDRLPLGTMRERLGAGITAKMEGI